MPMPALLGVDVGLHTGLALYGADGRLRWARSQHLGSIHHLRRAAPALLYGLPEAEFLLLEGGGPLADAWTAAAVRAGRSVERVSAETWRGELLYPREQRSGPDAKRAAESLARGVIGWSALSQPKTLRHDTAEAILVGLWGVIRLGWLAEVPSVIRQARP